MQGFDESLIKPMDVIIGTVKMIQSVHYFNNKQDLLLDKIIFSRDMYIWFLVLLFI